MEELFISWWKEKYFITTKDSFVYANSRDVRLVKFWLNIWNEQNWKNWYLRPVLVYKKLRWVYLCIPLTTKGKHPFYHYKIKQFFTKKDSYLVFNQIRVLDKKRFVHKMYKISEEEFVVIKKLFYKVLFEEEFLDESLPQ